jgi:hypothetical protein
MPRSSHPLALPLALSLLGATAGFAEVGDPQIRTDHPWYPGELACSTFDRLFATQAEQYQRMTGVTPKTDEEKALASWAWRNTHLAHGEEGTEDLWEKGFTKGDLRTRDYWTGLFADGFALCGTTHSQWTAELEQLLGHGRGRGVGVQGHNSFEVFLKGGAYGAGKWALLDHDISTVIYDATGKTLLSIPEVKSNWKQLTDRKYQPQKQNGWLVCGLHPGDGGVYQDYNTAEYLAGYASAPPMVHLRRGEKLRRYFEPGLEDGKTFVFWGRNYNAGGIPGPERSQTWVNQPEAMHGSAEGTPFKAGQARFANAVYTYEPDFASGAYREGVVAEAADSVTFEFYTPYIIGATPANTKPWGIYDEGGRNGLVLHGKAKCPVAISVDQGGTWQECGDFADGMDLTDRVKGHRQYLLRLGAGAPALARAGVSIRTACQANAAVLPRLKDGGTQVSYAASHQAVLSAGPNRAQAKAHVVAGRFESPTVTLAMAAPRQRPISELYATAQVASGNPPDRSVKYQIEYSLDAGATWQPIVKDWTFPKQGEEPPDFWSQSFCYGFAEVPPAATGNVQVRFANSGRKNVLRASVDVVYRTEAKDATKVTYDWIEAGTPRQETHTFAAADSKPWPIKTGAKVKTRWVEFEPVAQ